MSDHAKTDSTVLGPQPGATASAAGPTQRVLCVEGWRFIHHSYALVNQWQLLALLKRPDVKLSVRDLPFCQSHWRRSNGLLDTDEENALAAIPPCDASDSTAATLRLSFPFDFSLRSGTRTAVFGTAEIQTVPQSQFAAPIDLKKLLGSDSFVVITPSRWSRVGFLRLGLRAEQVRVVPHGVQSNIFRPSSDGRAPQDASHGFTFANASSMTDNKGIDLLLRAFAAVAERRPDVRLLLKGADDLYSSKILLNQMLSDLPSHSRRLVVDRLHYSGGAFSVRQMAEFYQSADAYVSPYRAEGFNLPVLEASACGTPVICTKGGPTDDFMGGDFALFIDSQVTPFTERNMSGFHLKPSIDHLIELMLYVMEDEPWRRKASRAGAAQAAANYNWDTVAGRLLDAIFASS